MLIVETEKLKCNLSGDLLMKTAVILCLNPIFMIRQEKKS